MSEGSNIDLGSVHEVIADIKTRESQLEQAERDAKQALGNYNTCIKVNAKSYAEAYLGAVNEKNVTARRMAAKVATVEEDIAERTSAGISKYMEKRVASCKALLFAAQSRANLLKEQMRL